MARKATFLIVALLVVVLAVYTLLVTPRRFIQCLLAPITYLRRDFGETQQATPTPLLAGARRAGNSVRLLVNGNEALPAMLAMIDSAQTSIRWQVMLFEPDQAGYQLADGLVRAARRGVQVQLSFNINQTVNGTIDGRFSAETKKRNRRQMDALLNKLKDAGVEVCANPAGVDFPLQDVAQPARSIQEQIQRNTCISANHYDHRKLLIVDARQVWMGGMNIGEHYLYHLPPDLALEMCAEARQRQQSGQPEAWEKWFDTSAILEGPVVADVLAAFNWKWEVLGGRPLPAAVDAVPAVETTTGASTIKILQQRPGDPQIGAQFFELVNHAQHEIWVASPFVSYDPALEALQAASRRGVRVVFVYPNAYLQGGFSGRVFRGSVNGLVEAGVELHFNDLRMAHTKLLVVDGRSVMTGSFNLNHRSFRHDLEIVALVEDESFARQVIERVFQPYLQISPRVVAPLQTGWNLIDWLVKPFS